MFWRSLILGQHSVQDISTSYTIAGHFVWGFLPQSHARSVFCSDRRINCSVSRWGDCRCISIGIKQRLAQQIRGVPRFQPRILKDINILDDAGPRDMVSARCGSARPSSPWCSFPSTSHSVFPFLIRETVLWRRRCSKIPVSASLSGSWTLWFRSTTVPLLGPVSSCCCPRFTPFALRSFSVVYCCILWYWLGFYRKNFHPLFFSCIAERVRDIVGQQLEIRKREWVTPWNKHAKSNCKRTVPFGNKAVKPQKLHSSGWNKPATQSPFSTAPSAKGAVSQVKRSVPKTAAPWTWRQPHSFLRRTTDV